MSYYTHILAKYDISNCKTFKDVKSKFSDTSPAFLRKVIYLKGFRITKEGRLRKQKRKRYPKVNCPQCGKEIFLVFPNDPFCSTKCRKDYRKTRAKETRKQGLSINMRARKPDKTKFLGSSHFGCCQKPRIQVPNKLQGV